MAAGAPAALHRRHEREKPTTCSIRQGLPVFKTGRGGQYTYHGPGQRVAYVMLDLAARRRMDLRCFVRDLERWLIGTLTEFGVVGMCRDGRIGIWVETEGGDAKIAAIGVRVRRWVTFHGVSLNVAPDLAHYRGIVACGIREHGVTSLAALGIEATMSDVDLALYGVISTPCSVSGRRATG